MKQAMVVYVLAMLLALPQCADAESFYVDFPAAKTKGNQRVCITYGDCETCTEMKNSDFQAFADQINNEKSAPDKQTLRQRMVLMAMKRADNGCK